MKHLITVAALATAAVASGCATTEQPYYTLDSHVPVVATAGAASNPTVVIAQGDNGAIPYRQESMFFRDRGLHHEVPSALTPKIVVGPPAG